MRAGVGKARAAGRAAMGVLAIALLACDAASRDADRSSGTAASENAAGSGGTAALENAASSGSAAAPDAIERAADAAAERIAIAGGSFIAGCDPAQGDACLPDELPNGVREVAAFAIDRTEVTVAAYRRCVEAGACTPPDVAASCNWGLDGRERHPVNCVDWEQAKAYCAFANGRLPTEWEWEKAARGSEGRKNPWGDAPADCRVAILDEGGGNGCGAGDTTFEVGSRPDGATPEGVVDLIGNVWEWTDSVRESSASPIVRGGAWYSEPKDARASYLLRFKSFGRGPYVGLRCAE